MKAAEGIDDPLPHSDSEDFFSSSTAIEDVMTGSTALWQSAERPTRTKAGEGWLASVLATPSSISFKTTLSTAALV
jgi:hypothetical protein